MGKIFPTFVGNPRLFLLSWRKVSSRWLDCTRLLPEVNLKRMLLPFLEGEYISNVKGFPRGSFPHQICGI